MREYKKPEFFVTEFAANHAITACAQDPNQTAYEFTTNQTVNCFITTSEDNLFSTKCDKNAGTLSNSYVVSGDEVNYTDTNLIWSTSVGGDGKYYWGGVNEGETEPSNDNQMYYYLWKNSTNDMGGGGINESFVKLLNAVFYVATGKTNAEGWHVGFISQSLVQQIGQPS